MVGVMVGVSSRGTSVPVLSSSISLIPISCLMSLIAGQEFKESAVWIFGEFVTTSGKDRQLGPLQPFHPFGDADTLPIIGGFVPFQARPVIFVQDRIILQFPQ